MQGLTINIRKLRYPLDYEKQAKLFFLVLIKIIISAAYSQITNCSYCFLQFTFYLKNLLKTVIERRDIT